MGALDKKTVFLTGGAQGLGQAYLQRFLEEGARIFYGDVNAELGKSTEAYLQSRFGKENVFFFPFDVTDEDKFKEAFSKAISHFGTIDIMVNNAGILNEAAWEKTIEINYVGTVRGTKLAMDHMRKDKGGKGGRIINISSIMGLATHFSQPVYCSSKQAVRAYTSALSMTPGLDSLGIEIAALCPDITSTDMITKLDDDKIIGYTHLKDKIDERMMPVSAVVDGLFSLLHKEVINGALLLITKNGRSYQAVERKDLGPDWPIQ